MAYQPCSNSEPHEGHWLGEQNGSTDTCPGVPVPPANPNPHADD